MINKILSLNTSFFNWCSLKPSTLSYFSVSCFLYILHLHSFHSSFIHIWNAYGRLHSIIPFHWHVYSGTIWDGDGPLIEKLMEEYCTCWDGASVFELKLPFRFVFNDNCSFKKENDDITSVKSCNHHRHFYLPRMLNWSKDTVKPIIMLINAILLEFSSNNPHVNWTF